MKAFKDRVKELREQRQITQEELAQAVTSFSRELSLTASQVQGFEDGSMESSPIMLSCIAQYFGVSVQYLLGKDNSTVEAGELLDNFVSLRRYRFITYHYIELDSKATSLLEATFMLVDSIVGIYLVGYDGKEIEAGELIDDLIQLRKSSIITYHGRELSNKERSLLVDTLRLIENIVKED